MNESCHTVKCEWVEARGECVLDALCPLAPRHCAMWRTVRRDSFIHETCLIHMWEMTHSYDRNVSFIREKWHVHMSDMTHSCVRHDSFKCETWLIPMWDMTHSRVRHHLFLCETRLTRVLAGCVCCSVLQCVTVWCDVLQCVEMCCSVLHNHMWHDSPWMSAARVLAGRVWTTPTTPWL